MTPREKLKYTADIMRQVERFDLDSFFGDSHTLFEAMGEHGQTPEAMHRCGTTACIVGHMAFSPAWIADGVKVDADKHPGGGLAISYEGETYVSAFLKWLDPEAELPSRIRDAVQDLCKASPHDIGKNYPEKAIKYPHHITATDVADFFDALANNNLAAAVEAISEID